MSPYFYCLSTNVSFFLLFVHNCLFLFWLLPMSFPFVYFLSIKVSFLLLLFIHQCLFWFWLFTNVFIFDLLFIHQCLLLDVVYPLLFLSVLVVHQFLHLLFIVYPPAQCLLLVLWIHQCLLVLAVHLCLPFVIVCPQMYPFSNSLSTMSTFRKC